jgi:two-component system chemotaxis response regulator CheY
MHTDLAHLRVYLVEPSGVQARLVTSQLEAHGITDVRHFETAGAMLAACHRDLPGLVISAMYLADMSGTDLVTRLRAEEDTADTPFILISSETRPQMLEPVRQSGVCGILPKPFSQKQLDTALRATLDLLDSDTPLDMDEADLAEVKVLLVDDSLSSRRFMRRVLENLGITQFIEAANGSEAVMVLNDTTVNLVVTDYNMPEMDGKALIDYIRQRSWQSTVPVLMVTGESDYSRLAAVEEAGVSGICDKPFEPAVVRTLLTRILREGQ